LDAGTHLTEVACCSVALARICSEALVKTNGCARSLEPSMKYSIVVTSSGSQ